MEGLDTHSSLMLRAIELARRGRGRTSPNPCVGAVIAKDGKVIGEGYHQVFGGAHAEIEALARVDGTAQGSTLYVTLEPCSHFGKTPPCADAVIKAGIHEVHIGAQDPNPRVRGAGMQRLREAGIQVRMSPLHRECSALIEGFAKHVTTGTPFVTLKLAESLDGYIAPPESELPRWLTSEASRKRVHEDRREHDAIGVGIGTVLTDNPALTLRLAQGVQPWRVIFDSKSQCPMTSRVVSDDFADRTILLHTAVVEEEKKQNFTDRGVSFIQVEESPDGHIHLVSALQALGRYGITSLFLESGERLSRAFLQAKLVDRLMVYQTKCPLGEGKKIFLDTPGGVVEELSAWPKYEERMESIGGDTLTSFYLHPPYRSP